MILNSQCVLISVVGGKGGVGKSVFAANLAYAIQLELKTQVLLIDADAKSCGDQNIILNVKPNKTISEVANFQGSLTPQSIPQLVTAHKNGLHYIGAVRGPEEILTPNVELFMKSLEFLSRHYKFIVADLGNDFKDLQKSLMNESTGITIVTTPEVLVVTQTQRLINELVAATFPLDMFQLVINRASPSGLSPQAIAQTLRIAPLGIIPQDDVTSITSIQKGEPFVASARQAPITAAYHDYVRKLGGQLHRLKTLSRPQAMVNTAATANTSNGSATSALNLLNGNSDAIDARTSMKIRVHTALIKEMDLKKGITETNNDPAKEAQLRQKTQQMITMIVDREAPGIPREERSRIIKEVLEEALGLGPLEDLLADNAVSEIMVNGSKKIFVERGGKITLSPVTFTSNMHLRNVIERIVTPLGRRIDEKTPYVDARLKDGSRVNAVIEPLSIDGPAVTIRKFKKGGINPEKYLEFGSLTKGMIDFLKICVENGMNVVISGGTGSGKTSLLNMLSSFIPSHDRIVTIEDAAELQLNQEHVVRLESRPSNMEGSGAVTIRDLVKNALRMRPDRIIVGECRDGAALDMLQAMNTGHDGSMTTTHANTPKECIGRLETLCMMAGMGLPVEAIKSQIASAVHLIIQQSRLSDGSRKVTSITEVQGMQGEVVTLAEIFKFKETGYDINRKIKGQFQFTGTIPKFVEKLTAKGIIIPDHIFKNEPASSSGTNSGPNSANTNSVNNGLPGMSSNMNSMASSLKKTGTGGKI